MKNSGVRRENWLTKDIVVLSLTSFFSDFCREMATALLPVLVRDLVGGSRGAIYFGIMNSISNAVMAISRFCFGLISDHVRYHKPFLALGFSITAIFTALLGTVHSVALVIIYRTMAWFGRGVREPVEDAWLSRLIKPANYGKLFGFSKTLSTFGSTLGPITVFILLNYVSVQATLFFALVPGLLAVLLLLFVQEKYWIPLETSTNWYKNTQALPRKFKNFIFVMTIFDLINFNKVLIVYRALETSRDIPEYSLFLVKSISIFASLLYSIHNIIRAISAYFIGKLGDKINRKNLLASLGFGLFSLTNIGLVFVSTQIWLWIIIFIGCGISTAAITTLKRAYSAELLPENIRGTGYGVLQAVDGFGRFISNIVVGALWSIFSPAVGFGYVVIISAISTILLLNTNKPEK